MTSPFNVVMIGAMIFAKHAKPSNAQLDYSKLF
jgi:hypothetical protein